MLSTTKQVHLDDAGEQEGLEGRRGRRARHATAARPVARASDADPYATSKSPSPPPPAAAADVLGRGAQASTSTGTVRTVDSSVIRPTCRRWRRPAATARSAGRGGASSSGCPKADPVTMSRAPTTSASYVSRTTLLLFPLFPPFPFPPSPPPLLPRYRRRQSR